ncbi:hypothetical protein ACL1CZ_13810 [Corynebacterium striatum]
MPKTLADMTTEERANCRGMWAGTFSGYTGIIVYENGKQAYLIIPEYLGDYKGMTNVYHFDGDPTHRRFVGEWEEA